MITCRFLSSLYGRDTRGTQWLSLSVAVMWIVGIIANDVGILELAIPENISGKHELICFFATSFIFTAIGFCTQGKVHQVNKTFGLAVGALSQAIVANGYVSSYPPLDPMLVLSTILCVWLFGAVCYVICCEGKNGLHRHTL